MRIQILALLVAFTAASSLPAATGTHLIGLSPRSTAMGGTGLASPMGGADALYRNPAHLVDNQVSGVPGAVTLEVDYNLVSFGSEASSSALGFHKNETGAKSLPAIAATYRISEDWAASLGLFGYGGAGIAYSSYSDLLRLKTDLQLARLAPAIAWRPIPILNIGISPFLKYGAFALNEDQTGVAGGQSTRAPHGGVGGGVAIGATVEATEGVHVAASFTTRSGIRYKDAADLDRFGAGRTATNGGLDTIEVQSPHELGLGVSYQQEDFRILVDYRWLGWSKAAGYRELGWKDQSVWSAGAEYTLGWWAFRAGVLTANSPIESATESPAGEVDFQGHRVATPSISRLNMIAFPAISTTHLTLGTGYSWGERKQHSIDAAFVYMPKVERERISTAPTGPAAYTLRAQVSSWQLGLGLRYEL